MSPSSVAEMKNSRWFHWRRNHWTLFHLRSTASSFAAWPLGSLFPALGQDGFGVITYHRVCDRDKQYGAPTCSVSPSTFRRQLLGLRKRGYEAWPLRRCVEWHRQGRLIPRNVFAIVFDDGYENVYTRAWPILRELQMPATVFTPTAYLDSPDPMPFDDWDGVGREGVATDTWRHLSSRQCREMLEDGLIDFGTHTHTHQDFRGRGADFQADLEASLQALEQLGVSSAALSLPYGFVCPQMMDVIRDLDLLCCLTCQQQVIRADDQTLLLGTFRRRSIRHRRHAFRQTRWVVLRRPERLAPSSRQAVWFDRLFLIERIVRPQR